MYSIARLNDLAKDFSFAEAVRGLAAELARGPAVRQPQHLSALLQYGPRCSGTALRLLKPHVWLDVDRIDGELAARLACLAEKVERTRD